MSTHHRPLVVVIAVLAVLAALGGPLGTSAEPIGDGIVVEQSNSPNGEYVTTSGGEIAVDLTDGTGVVGGGVPARATTRFDDVFRVLNTNDQLAYVWITDDSDVVGFYASRSGRPSIEGQANEIRLGDDGRVAVGLLVDTTAATPGTGLTADPTIHVRLLDGVEALLEHTSPIRIEDDVPVSFDAAGSRGYSPLSYQWTFGDGATSSAGGALTHVYDEPGVYDVTVTVTDDTGDTGSVTRPVVVGYDSVSRAVDGDDPTTVTFGDAASPVRQIVVDSSVAGSGEVRAGSLPVSGLSVLAEGHSVPADETLTGVNVTVPSAQEDAPATVSLTVDSDVVGGASPSSLTVYRYDEATEQWSSLPTSVGSVSEETVTLNAETPGFSLFAVGAGETDDTGDGDTGDGDTGGGGAPPGGGSGGAPPGGGTVDDVESPTTTTSTPTTPTTTTTTTPTTTTPTPTTPTTPTTTTTTTTQSETTAPSEVTTGRPTAATSTTPPGEPGGVGLTPVLGLVSIVALLGGIALYRLYRDEDRGR